MVSRLPLSPVAAAYRHRHARSAHAHADMPFIISFYSIAFTALSRIFAPSDDGPRHTAVPMRASI